VIGRGISDAALLRRMVTVVCLVCLLAVEDNDLLEAERRG
jgi:hypothetical protein